MITRYAWRLAVSLAFLAQCWIAVAPLSEGRGLGLSAHVENAGNHRGHFTHDEASCPACSVLSLHVLTSHPVVIPVPAGPPVFRPVAPAASWTEAVITPSSQPRAPPSFV
jgi:hypothetical protein